MQSRDIQSIFTEFFAERGHTNVSSSSLIPPSNDPTVLLTTAGMQQMTPYFLGLETPPDVRMTSTQKCFRTVDIDEVGDETHCTFFEMLGNFSVGDYFKRESIRLGWQLLTEVYGIDPGRMTVTVNPEDDETRQLWISEIGLTLDRIYDDPSNIWGPVGDSGPCGPNSEIYVDRGEQYGCGEPDCGPLCERCDRHLEVWNHVFMQWFQEKDGSRRELERKNIDTGMGLERISMILQDAPSMYDTDLYQPIIRRASEISGKAYKADPQSDRSMRVIADHGRAVTFLIADGVLPGNEGRGYVLRRILRRAVRHGRLLGIERPFLTEIADVVVTEFGDRYPELHARRETIRRVIQNEEESFGRTLATGISRFDALADEVRRSGGTVLHGAEAFRLYDTYGFPFELTAELARDAGLEIDVEAFAEALEQSRARSRAAVKGFADSARGRVPLYAAAKGAPVEFAGYERVRNDATITDLFGEDSSVEQLEAGQPGEVVLDTTVFYGESGGQVGDTGTISTETGVFTVHDTQRPTPTLLVHRGEVSEGFIRADQLATAEIDANRRDAIRRNHTATHVLHRALRMVLGNETHQAGSLVAPDRLRFDFTSLDALGNGGLDRVTEIANAIPLQNIPVIAETMPYADAIEDGAMALFGEKYGDVVRVVKIGDYSAELCGGTHVSATGEIGPIVILAESSIGSGVRRIEAVTGDAAIRHLLRAHLVTSDLSRTLHAPVEGLLEEVRQLTAQLRERDRELEQLRLALATTDIDGLIQRSVSVDGANVLATRVPADDRETMLQIGDRLRDRMRSGVIVLASEIDSQPALLAMVTKDQVGRGLSAGKLIQEIAPIVGGRGGGRPELAQGGGSDASKLDEALASVVTIVKRQISG
ncbi:MAG TPA: alanine--tRNA ligase [Thermomicrobiales bacterium]|nr:alanine--tRNA ligase [Thermomicrobiales bacterium]